MQHRSVCSIAGMILVGKQKYWRNMSQCHFVHHRTHMGRPATNDLSQGTAFKYHK
jgi:hypothetical protein